MTNRRDGGGVIDTPNLHLAWFAASRDSALFGFPVLQISDIGLRTASAVADFQAFESSRDQIQAGLVSCRLFSGCLKESMLLEERGFRFIEMIYRPELDGLQTRDFPAPTEIEIRRAGNADLPMVQEIASSAFHNERFHVDPRLNPRIASQRYRNWATSSFAHPRQRLYCVHGATGVVGFFVTEMLDDGTCYWHLNALAPEAQGKGWGVLAWQAMMDVARQAGAARIRTCIAARNHRVLNLYSRLGFRFPAPDMTFHWARSNRFD